MNRKILQKVIDALNQENVDISYIRGILETLIESLPEEKTTGPAPMSFREITHPILKEAAIAAPVDEGEQLDRMTTAKMNNVDLTAIKTE